MQNDRPSLQQPSSPDNVNNPSSVDNNDPPSSVCSHTLLSQCAHVVVSIVLDGNFHQI